jgi:ribosomal protein S18 acetylase RimI-like enzyme
MHTGDILKLYDAEVRARPRPMPGLTIERIDGVLVLTGHFNFVCCWDFAGEDAGRIVGRLAARFRASRPGLTWDVYDHDRPAGLGDHLAAAGFAVEHESTLLVMDLRAATPTGPADVEVRRVGDHADLIDFVRVSAEAFGKSADWQLDAYAGQLDSNQDILVNAYVDGEAAGSSRLELTPGCRFGGLFGGAVSPRFQGRGLYRAMVAARAGEARARGAEYLSTGARETSRPILERLGFTPVTRITRWVLAGGGQAARRTSAT